MTPTGLEPSSALLTDQYELTMLDAALQSGVATHRAVFEVYARSLPNGRRYGVVAGTQRVVEAILAFRFEEDDVRWLSGTGIVSPETARWLANYRFSGTVWGYPEGELYFPGSPILTVEGSFADAVILETVILSIFNHDSGVATTAARMVTAAQGRNLIEMGSRRTSEQAAVAAARAAYIAGFGATSNLMAGRRYGIPTTGTSAHAFTLAHTDEPSAFAAQVAAFGSHTTLLVDTYDIAHGIENAVIAAGTSLGAIRIDSGDLFAEAEAARLQLDRLGALRTKIVVSGDLDEYSIAELTALGDLDDNAAPIDGFGVGTKLVTGASCPAPGFVYKLVAIADSPEAGASMRPVAKKSTGKMTVGGRKEAYRRHDQLGIATAEVLVIAGCADRVDADDEPLQRELIVRGEACSEGVLAVARHRCRQALSDLPSDAMDLAPGEPAIPTEYVLPPANEMAA